MHTGQQLLVKSAAATFVLGAALAAVPLVIIFAAEAAPRPAARIAQELCAGCHGPNLVGANAPNLLDSIWIHGGSDADILFIANLFGRSLRRVARLLPVAPGTHAREQAAMKAAAAARQ